MKPDIVIVAKLHQPTQEILEKEFTAHRLYEATDRDAFLKALAPKVRGIASGGAGVNAAMMDALPNLKLIAHFGVGYDSVDVDAAKKRGIRVTNTPDVLNDCVADTAIALTLNTLRKFPQAEAYLRSNLWAARGGYPLTTSLGGKTMGIVGLGRIGEAIAKRAQASGMKIAYHNRNRKDVPYPYYPDPVSLAKACDVLMIVTPGGAETKNLVNAKVLDALGPQGYLVNIARGSVVDQPVLLRYLQERRIAGAGLDVFTEEPKVPAGFYSLDNAVLFPHVGSATHETRFATGIMQVDNLCAMYVGKPLVTSVG
jgi:lactate dehydrogenase-like 2-hydroxyacid dehydrogenase